LQLHLLTTIFAGRVVMVILMRYLPNEGDVRLINW